MSQQGMAQFIGALPDNPVWAERLREEVGSHLGKDAIAAVARVASDVGYDVSAADAEAFRAEALDALQDREIDDESLSKVAGGVFGVDDVLFLGVLAAGIGGTTAVGLVGGAVIGGSAVGGATLALSKDVRNGAFDFFSKW